MSEIDTEVRDNVTKLVENVKNLTDAFKDFSLRIEQSTARMDERLRIVEMSVQSLDKITCLEDTLEKHEKRIIILERNDTFTDGMNKVIYAVIGAGFAIALVLIAWVLTLIF